MRIDAFKNRRRIAGTLLAVSAALSLTTCAKRPAPVWNSAVAPTNPDVFFVDLQAGWRLRVVTPILKSGGYILQDLKPASGGGSLSSDDLTGYEIAYYAVKPNRGGVKIEFSAAETHRGDIVTHSSHRIVPLFQLPASAKYLRLLFLIRVSASDHNMAVLAADRMDSLEELTKQVRSSPETCRNGVGSFCSWVPAGISVRPESMKADTN